MKPEYEKELKMKYDELCNYLITKYGHAQVDYFPNSECKRRDDNVSRTSEGLLCHHILEDRYILLSNAKMARQYPFEAQKKEKLVYCNYLEHLILHLKINLNAQCFFEEPFEINYFFISDGFYEIAQELNDLYKNNGSSKEWCNNCYEVIKDDFQDYVEILRGVFCLIEENYFGDKTIDFSAQTEIAADIFDKKMDENALRGHQFDRKRVYFIVVKVDRNKDIITLSCLDDVLSSDLDSLKETDFPYGYVGASEDKSLLFYKYSLLKRKYDYDIIIAEKKDILASLKDNTKWDRLIKELERDFDSNDSSVAELLNMSVNDEVEYDEENFTYEAHH